MSRHLVRLEGVIDEPNIGAVIDTLKLKAWDCHNYGECDGMMLTAEEDNGQNVTICHRPGTPAEKTMSIPISDLAGHLTHGDHTGACN